MNRIRVWLLLSLSCVLAACTDPFGTACTDELRPNLVVVVREAESGKAAARGAIGTARHLNSAVSTELSTSFNDSLLSGDWIRERAGRYSVTVQKPGFRTEFALVEVEEDACHVRTQHVPVTLTRDPAALAVAPLRFERGLRVGGSSASAGITVSGDTLVIMGRAAALCGELDLVAYRSSQSWHIQFQPQQWDACSGELAFQQFEARFRLEPGNNHLLITDASHRPSILFTGTAQGTEP